MDSYWGRLSLEALVVGLVLALVYAVVLRIGDRVAGARLDHKWVMLLAAFVSGVLVHLGFEALGTNRWYCLQGAACRA